jgi:AcrR family transcriptional regulator
MAKTSLRTDIRDSILDATEHLLVRYGYKKMTMDDLAREAGIGKGTIYLYFSSKEEVALCSIDRLIDRVQEQLGLIAHNGDGVSNRLRQMLITRILYRFDNLHQDSQSLDQLLAALRPAFLARRQLYFDAEAEIFAEILNEGCHLGTFEFKDALTTAHTLLLATNSLLPYSLSARELGNREEVEQKISRIADLLVYGLLRRDPSQAS